MLRSLLRSIGAVLAGYLLFALTAVALFQFAGRDPHAPQPFWFMALATAWGMGFAAAGGLLAVRLSADRSVRHAAILAGVVALGAVVSLLTSPAADAIWSQRTALALMAPSAWFGAWLRRK